MPPTPVHAAPDAQAAPPRAGRNPRSVVIFLLVAASVLALDLWLKAWAFEHVAGSPVLIDPQDPAETYIPHRDPVVLVPRVLAFQLTLNKGAVFGLGKGARGLFIAMSIVAAVVIAVVFHRSAPRDRVMHLALALVLAGALGNLYDRARFGVVRDMLKLFPGVLLPLGWSWPGHAREVYPWIFNAADAALVVGVATLLVVLWIADKRRQTAPAEPN